MKKRRTFLLFLRLAWREVRHHLTQFLAIIAIGAIAVTLFVGLEANVVSLQSRVSETYASGNMADLWVTSSRYTEKDEEKIASLLGAGEGYEKRFELSASLGSHSVLIAISDALPTISRPFDTEFIEKQSDTYFCYIDEAISKKSEAMDVYGFYGIGEKASVVYDLSSFHKTFLSLSKLLGLDSYFEEGKNPFLENKWTLDFEVTGIMKYPENITKASYGTSTLLVSSSMFMESLKEDFSSRLLSSLSEKEKDDALKTIAEVFIELGYFSESDGVYGVAPNQYLLKIPDKTRLKYVENALKESLREGRYSFVSVNSRENMPFFLTIESEMNQAKGFTYLFPFVFFFVAVLVILVTTSQMILKERSQIGTLKAIGVSKNGILLFYVGLVCSLVFLGILIGEIIGPILIPLIMGNKYGLIYTLPDLRYVFPIFQGILSAVLFLLASALTTLLVVYKEASLNPSESMRPSLPAFKAKGKRKGARKKESALFLSTKMAFRNIRVNIVKSIMVVVGVMGCTALLLTGYGIEDTVNYGINHDLAKVGDCDFTLTFSEGKKEGDFAEDISEIEGISGFEMYQNNVSKVENPSSLSVNSTIYVLTGAENTHFAFARGLKNDEVAVSKKIQESLSLQEGEWITFSIGNVKHTSKIAFFYEAFFYSGIALYSSNDIFRGEELSYNGVYLDLEKGTDIEKVRRALKEKLPYLLTSQSKADWRLKINNVLQGVLVMTGAVKIFAILLALVVLYNLALLNFNERSRDIATLKVLGFSLREIVLSLLLETMFLTSLGVLCGLALGYPFMLAVLSLNKVELVTYLYYVSPLSFFYSFLLTFVVAFFVNLFFGFKSKKIAMVESLKSVE